MRLGLTLEEKGVIQPIIPEYSSLEEKRVHPRSSIRIPGGEGHQIYRSNNRICHQGSVDAFLGKDLPV